MSVVSRPPERYLLCGALGQRFSLHLPILSPYSRYSRQLTPICVNASANLPKTSVFMSDSMGTPKYSSNLVKVFSRRLCFAQFPTRNALVRASQDVCQLLLCLVSRKSHHLQGQRQTPYFSVVGVLFQRQPVAYVHRPESCERCLHLLEP